VPEGYFTKLHGGDTTVYRIFFENVSFNRKAMEAAAKELDFAEAARLRDEMYAIEKLMKGK
jgi:excinuclease UvrABC helicase subunit UvrB